MVQLDNREQPTIDELERNIVNFLVSGSNRTVFGKYCLNNKLTMLKAIDAMKDGATRDQAKIAFDITGNDAGTFSSMNTDDLKTDIKGLFEKMVQEKRMRKIEYTRIKSVYGTPVKNLDIHYDYYIHDCGPTYAQGNGKTPEVKTLGNITYPTPLYSVGNKLDTGPSSSNAINLSSIHTIPYNVLEFLGYNNSSFSVTNNNTYTYTLNSSQITNTNINTYRVGNDIKNRILTTLSNSNLDEKRRYLFIKSLGDTLIVYYWLWLTKQLNPPTQVVRVNKPPVRGGTIPSKTKPNVIKSSKKIVTKISTNQPIVTRKQSVALLTCDTVVALQAYMLSFNISESCFVYNYVEKGKKHISYVYYKGGEIDYNGLFREKKNEIINRYAAEIRNFDTYKTNSKFTFKGETKIYTSNTLFTTVIERLNYFYVFINDMTYTTQENYTTLLKYQLIPLIHTIDGDTVVLIPSRKEFNLQDTTFISTKKPLYNLIITDKKFEYNIFNSIIGGATTDEDHFHNITITNNNNYNDDLAIYYLVEFIYQQVNDYIRKMDPSLLKIIKIKTKWYSQLCPETYFSPNYNDEKYVDSGTMYDLLTYEFYANPDYSKENIISLINKQMSEYIKTTPFTLVVTQPNTPRGNFTPLKISNRRSGKANTQAMKAARDTKIDLMNVLLSEGGNVKTKKHKNAIKRNKTQKHNKTQKRKNIIKRNKI